MKKLIVIALLSSVVWAADFVGYTTEELINKRGTIPVENRPAFREEMQKRMATMTSEQRQLFMQSKQQRSGMEQGAGMGRGAGGGMGRK
ncbi:MAG: DUF1104 domain-containing protein [Sulfurimonas sp.]|nr:DUF1104 domain-containing protein [Sulfurimonas sp.]